MGDEAREYSLSSGTTYSGPEADEQNPTTQSQQTKRKEADTMAIIIRETDHECDVHVKTVWETDFGKKVGVRSKKEYVDVFSEELEWDVHHQKWSSERTENTDMWEVDLDSVFAVVALLSDCGADVTVAEEVMAAYREAINE